MVTWTQCVVYGLPGFGFWCCHRRLDSLDSGIGRILRRHLGPWLWENDLSGSLWRICGEFWAGWSCHFFNQDPTIALNPRHPGQTLHMIAAVRMMREALPCFTIVSSVNPHSPTFSDKRKFQLVNHKISNVANPMPRTSINNLLGMVYKFIPSTYVFLLVTLIVLDEIVLSHTNIYELPRSPKFVWWFYGYPIP